DRLGDVFEDGVGLGHQLGEGGFLIVEGLGVLLQRLDGRKFRFGRRLRVLAGIGFLGHAASPASGEPGCRDMLSDDSSANRAIPSFCPVRPRASTPFRDRLSPALPTPGAADRTGAVARFVLTRLDIAGYNTFSSVTLR